MKISVQLILTLSLFFLAFAESMVAQSSPQNSLYMIDKYKINPAYGGLDRSLSINLNYRSQWNGFEKKPRQFYLNAHLPIYLFNGAAGFEIYSDQLGLINTTGLNFSYNYVQTIPGGLMSGGIRLGLEQNSLDGNAIITPDGEYVPGNINHNDPILPLTNESAIAPFWTVGGFISHNYYDIGLTISNFFPSGTGLSNLILKSSSVATIFVQVPVYLGDYELLPSVLFKTDLDILQTDISCLVKNGNIFGGLSLRGYNEKSFDALVVIGGIRLNQHYTLTYSYDAGLSDIKNLSQGSHEIHINYNLNKRIAIGLPPEIIYNPRNL